MKKGETMVVRVVVDHESHFQLQLISSHRGLLGWHDSTGKFTTEGGCDDELLGCALEFVARAAKL